MLQQGTDEWRQARYPMGARGGALTFNGLIDAPRGKGKRLIGSFACDCGKQIEFPASRVLVEGSKTHCGCQTNRATNLRHGGRYSPEYSSWIAMRRRCLNPADKDYPGWGGAGITVYPEWARSFETFLAYMGPRPPRTSIDRIDPRRGYQPGNVRWATSGEQARNKKHSVNVKTPLGEMPLVDYARAIGITNSCAHWRLNHGKLEGVSHVR